MVLEGARQLDVARTTLQGAEQKENKIKKELKKVSLWFLNKTNI